MSASGPRGILDRNTSIRDVTNYSTGGHKSSAHGIVFHEQYMLLAAYRSVAAGVPFCMTCEVEQAGKFDDLVYFHERDDAAVACELVQYKHKETNLDAIKLPTLTSRSNPFSLVEYFNSYLSLADVVRFEDRFQCRIGHCVLLTNVGVDPDFVDRNLVPCADGPVDRLSVGRSYRFRVDAVDREPIVRALVMKATNVKRIGLDPRTARQRVGAFLDRFVISVDNRSDIEPEIKQEIAACLRNERVTIAEHPSRIDVIYKCLYNRIYHFHSTRDVCVVTDADCARWLRNAAEKMGTDMLPVYHEFNMNRLDDFGETVFERQSVVPLERFLFDGAETTLSISARECTLFSVLKVVQVLRQNGNSFHTILDEQFLLLLDEDIVAAEAEFLIIVGDSDGIGQRVSCKIEHLSRIAARKIVVVSRNRQDRARAQSCTSDAVGWSDLDERSRQKLGEKCVTFQGRRCAFSTIDISLVHGSIQERLLMEIVDETLSIPTRPADRPDDFFVDRKISIRDRIDPAVLSGILTRKRAVLVENIGRDEFRRAFDPSGPVYRVERRCDFEESCREHRGRDVALLHHRDGRFYLKKSTGRWVSRCVCESTECVDLYDVSCVRDRTVLIVAEPGMGKSRLLSTLVQRSVERRPHEWIVKIDLSGHTGRFDRMKRNGAGFDVATAVEFVLDAQDFRTDFERELFRSYFSLEDRLIVLFDGFDEIAPDYRETVLGLVVRLASIRTIRVWLTSRPQERDRLESRLGIIAYSIVPFSVDDQHVFFREFWKERADVDETSVGRLDVFIDHLLAITSESFPGSDASITGLPLQCRILGEVYQDDFERFWTSDDDETELPSVIDILDVYEQFVEKIFRRHIVEKAGWSTTNQANRRAIDVEYRKLNKSHRLLGVDVAFPGLAERTDKLVEYRGGIVDGTERTGIVYALGDDGRPVFVHRTFAEYFAALWFHDRLTDGDRDLAGVLADLFAPEHDVFRRFFDRIAAKRSVGLRHVLNNDAKRVETLLGDAQVDSLVDDFGRNALHLAAAYRHEGLVRVLADAGVSTVRQDRLFRWTPLEYGFRAGIGWSSIDVLLAGNERDRTIFDRVPDRECALLEASRRGHARVVRYLLSNRTSIEVEDALTRIPLHLAAKHGHETVCASLIEHGSQINREDWFGRTPLHHAALRGHAGIVTRLLESRADVNMLVCYKDTALHYAFEAGHAHVVDAFVAHDPDALSTVKYAETLIHSAVRSGRREIVEMLVRRGVDVNGRNYWNETPIDIALATGNREIVQLLIDNDACI